MNDKSEPPKMDVTCVYFALDKRDHEFCTAFTEPVLLATGAEDIRIVVDSAGQYRATCQLGVHTVCASGRTAIVSLWFLQQEVARIILRSNAYFWQFTPKTIDFVETIVDRGCDAPHKEPDSPCCINHSGIVVAQHTQSRLNDVHVPTFKKIGCGTIDLTYTEQCGYHAKTSLGKQKIEPGNYSSTPAGAVDALLNEVHVFLAFATECEWKECEIPGQAADYLEDRVQELRAAARWAGLEY